MAAVGCSTNSPDTSQSEGSARPGVDARLQHKGMRPHGWAQNAPAMGRAHARAASLLFRAGLQSLGFRVWSGFDTLMPHNKRNITMTWFHFIRNFPMGASFGVFMGAIFIIVIQGEWPDDLQRYGTYGITAIVTLLASAIALTTAIWNTETARHRKLKAAKASLPLALSRLIETARNGVQISMEDDAFFNDPENAYFIEKRLAIPNEVFNTLKECIEFGDETSAQWLTNIIAHYQVYKARLVNLTADRNMPPHDVYRAEHAAEWIFWHAMVSHLFDFARGEDTVENAMQQERLLEGFYAEIWGNRLQQEITGQINGLAEYHAPLNAKSLAFRPSPH
ncbi:MAG: hypothetical protein HLUCCO07_12695 [Rhodobacteraceae bacterium HLUCCO07]|nr:MAG: hypothetical protein HLUCCO07_12695 [Rhodobacteraceae bacterium HLUCCO07]